MSIIQPITNKNLTNLSTRTKPNLTEELHCHQLQHVGNGGDIQNPAEHDRRSLPSHRSARRKRPQHPKPSRTAATQRAPPLLVTRPKQQLALPHQKQNHSETHTHPTQRRQTHHVDILKFQHLNSSKSSQFSKQNFNILALYLQDIFANTGFTISDVLRALILQLQIQCNFKQLLVMSVGFPLFMQTNPTSGKFWL